MSDTSPEALYQRLPSVREVLERPGVVDLLSRYSRPFVLDCIQEYLEATRRRIGSGEISEQALAGEIEQIEPRLEEWIGRRLGASLREIVNTTGVVVFTNAGRSPMSETVMEQVTRLACSYTNLEYDLDRGGRGRRDQHLECRLARLLAAESATACNNAAAAVLLILNTLAEGKNVIVSRGELIEIGGSFRIPAIMKKSGAILREVGTTNKTKASDYEEAIDSDTALLLRVHPSNYQIIGFTHRPKLGELVQIANRHKIPLVHDLGSGYLFATEHPFLQREPTAEESLKNGSDLVCFSGDKLLGGPQAGLILGRKTLIEQIRKNPLMRACRLDKMTIAALEWTLIEYEKGIYQQTLPAWQMLSLPVDAIRARAAALQQRLDPLGFQTETADGYSLTGGGSAPEEQIPTCLVAVRHDRLTPNQIETALRMHSVPILVRIEEDRVVIDLRTVFPNQDDTIAEAFEQIAT